MTDTTITEHTKSTTDIDPVHDQLLTNSAMLEQIARDVKALSKLSFHDKLALSGLTEETGTGSPAYYQLIDRGSAVYTSKSSTRDYQKINDKINQYANKRFQEVAASLNELDFVMHKAFFEQTQLTEPELDILKAFSDTLDKAHALCHDAAKMSVDHNNKEMTTFKTDIIRDRNFLRDFLNEHSLDTLNKKGEELAEYAREMTERHGNLIPAEETEHKQKRLAGGFEYLAKSHKKAEKISRPYGEHIKAEREKAEEKAKLGLEIITR